MPEKMYNEEKILSYKDDYEKEISELYSGRTIKDVISYLNNQVYGPESIINLSIIDYNKSAFSPFGERIYDKDYVKYFGERYIYRKDTNISDIISITEQDDPRGIILCYDDYSIIAIHSFDEIIWLDNKDNSDYLKLYFKYYELDDYYRKTLTKNSWDYNTNDEAWHKRNTPNNYRFAVKLIIQYDLETHKNDIQRDNSQNVSNTNRTSTNSTNRTNTNRTNTNTTNTNNYRSGYERRIIDLLMSNGKMKAVEIAKKLKLPKREVNRILYYKLSDICEKDESYRWYIKE